MTAADGGARKLRHSWVRAHQRRIEHRRHTPAEHQKIALRAGFEHVSTIVARVMERLTRAGGLSL